MLASTPKHLVLQVPVTVPRNSYDAVTAVRGERSRIDAGVQAVRFTCFGKPQ